MSENKNLSISFVMFLFSFYLWNTKHNFHIIQQYFEIYSNIVYPFNQKNQKKKKIIITFD